MICFAAVDSIAEEIARIWILYWSPTDIVANSKNDGTGTKGINEPKKLTRDNPMYPTSGAKGNRSAKSNNHHFDLRYLTIRSQINNLQKSLQSLKYHTYKDPHNGQEKELFRNWTGYCKD